MRMFLKLSICCSAMLVHWMTTTTTLQAQELPWAESTIATKLLEVPSYCEGVVFDHAGKGYISWDKTLTQFQLDRKSVV